MWKYLSDYQSAPLVFYGFAETKETEINMDQPLEILKVHVVPGQSVKKDDLLAEVRNAKTDLNIKALYNKIKALEAKEALWVEEKLRKCDALELERKNELSQLEHQISEAKAEIDFRKELWNGLKKVTPQPGKEKFSPLQYRLSELEKEYKNKKEEYDLRISNEKALIKAHASPYNQEINEIKSEIEYYRSKSERYSITAPHDGLIGNVHCKEGEFEDAFSTLISFYEANPTQVKGYVNENYILHVSINDEFEITSIKDQSLSYKGVLVGLGSRIVEIPGRMRKHPEIKTYGREVVIEIPPDNELLQKEKVMLELVKTTNEKNFLSGK